LIHDECEYIDLDEIESVNADLLEEFFPTMDDEMDVEIKETPTKIQNLTPCVIIDYINSEVKHCNSTTNLWRLQQIIGTRKIDAHAVENIQGNSTTNL
ncbi:19116_t:CDS:1, partial [Cetraspora pellucida]